MVIAICKFVSKIFKIKMIKMDRLNNPWFSIDGIHGISPACGKCQRLVPLWRIIDTPVFQSRTKSFPKHDISGIVKNMKNETSFLLLIVKNMKMRLVSFFRFCWLLSYQVLYKTKHKSNRIQRALWKRNYQF